MKKILLLLPLFVFLTSCDKDFEEINTNPTTANDIEPKLLFSTALLQGSGNPWQNEGAVLAYASCFVQHIASLSFAWQGDKYLYDGFHNDVFFNDAYVSEVKTLVDLIDKVKDDPEQINLHAAARIWKVLVFHRLTDLYGDLPYALAGRGFLDGNFQPEYDSQQEIYMAMLSELEAATTALDGSQNFIDGADFIYQGDIEKWRRFGNTLMLRLAMRIRNADPASAEAWAKKAIAAGVMQVLDDSALLPHSDGDILVQNGIGYVFANEDNGRLAKTFVDWMKDKNDPRLNLLSYVASGTEPKGLPNGLDENMLIAQTGDADLEAYSRVNPIFVQRGTPTMFQGYAEAEFMLAEAALLNWHSGDAATHYENGVRAAMQQLAMFDGSAVIADSEIDAYIADNPLPDGTTEEAIESINTQYWAATFLNGLEAYANWRRSGYPNLVPSNFPGNPTGGTIPLRLRYPQQEYSVNEVNVKIAVDRQGEDLLTTGVWWDK